MYIVYIHYNLDVDDTSNGCLWCGGHVLFYGLFGAKSLNEDVVLIVNGYISNSYFSLTSE